MVHSTNARRYSFAALFLLMSFTFCCFCRPSNAQESRDSIAMKSNSEVKCIVLWSKETIKGVVMLNATLSFLTMTPIVFDKIGYVIVPDWSEGASLPQRNYLLEATTDRLDRGNSVPVVNTIPACRDIKSLTMCCGAVIPLNRKVVNPAWNRDRLGVLFVFGLKGKPVFMGATKLPRPDEIRVGGQNSEELSFTLKDLVIMQTYIDDQQDNTGDRGILPPKLRANVKKQIKAAVAQAPDTPSLPQAIDVFVNACKNNPNLSEEQIFAVASIVGNAMGLNAKYFMAYRHGYPKHGGVIENPGYDYRDTSQNLPDE